MNFNLMYLNTFVDSFKSSNTKKMYLTDIMQLLEYISSKDFEANKGLNVSREFANEYLIQLIDASLAPSSIQRKIYSISSFFEFLIKRKVVQENHWKHLKLPSLNPKISKKLTSSQLDEFILRVKNESEISYLHRAILILLFSTGMKKSELINLRIRDFHNVNAPYLVIKSKHQNEIIKYISADAQRAIEEYLDILALDNMSLYQDSYLFRPSKNPQDGDLDKPLNPKSIDYVIRTWSLKLGFDKPLSTQDIRESKIMTALVSSRVNSKIVQSEFDIQRKAVKNYLNRFDK